VINVTRQGWDFLKAVDKLNPYQNFIFTANKPRLADAHVLSPDDDAARCPTPQRPALRITRISSGSIAVSLNPAIRIVVALEDPG
jgi:hypothetical protein